VQKKFKSAIKFILESKKFAMQLKLQFVFILTYSRTSLVCVKTMMLVNSEPSGLTEHCISSSRIC